MNKLAIFLSVQLRKYHILGLPQARSVACFVSKRASAAQAHWPLPRVGALLACLRVPLKGRETRLSYLIQFPSAAALFFYALAPALHNHRSGAPAAPVA